MMNGQNNYPITVLMSSYNGEKYIETQIQSIFHQNNVEVELIIRDDGSKDNTVNIVERLSELYNIKLIKGENIGAKASFYELIRKCPEATYVAFCDQDDYWIEEKLFVAINRIKNRKDVPVMYYSNLYVVNERLENRGKMFNSLTPKNFGQSLTYNDVVGCTLVINKCLLNIVKKSLSISPICYHDQWISLICNWFDGVKIADNQSYILYRQHENNEVGAKEGIKKKIMKSSFLRGKNTRSSIAMQMLESVKDFADYRSLPEAELIAMYDKSIKNKIKLINARYNRKGVVNFLSYSMSIILNLY